MSKFQPLIDTLFVEQVRRARESNIEKRFLDSLSLSELVLSVGRDALVSQMPDASEEEREQEWQRRRRIARLIDEAGMYAPVNGDATR